MRTPFSNRQPRHFGYFFVIAVASVVFLALNVLTTLKGDDIIYMFVSDSVPLARVHTLADLVQSMHNHYFTTNGRLANLIAQIFASFLGKGVFNVVNTLVFAAFVALVSRFAFMGCRAVGASLTVLFVLLFAPVPGETMLWMTGSCNYLWSMTASLAWMLALLHRPRHTSALADAGLAAVSLLVGSMNESVTATVLFGVIMYFAANRHHADRTAWLLIAVYAAGVAFVLASPGAWLRFDSGSDMPKDINALQMLTSRITRLLRQSRPIVLPFVAAAYGFWRMHRRNWRLRCIFSTPQACLFMASVAVMLIFGLNAQRPYFALATFSFIVVARAAAPVFNSRRTAAMSTAAVAALLCIPVTASAFGSVVRAKVADGRMAAAIRRAPAQCVLPAADTPPASRFVMDNIYNSAHYHSYAEFYCALYGKRNVCFLPSDIYARFAANASLLHDAVKLPYAVGGNQDMTHGIYAIPGVKAAIVPLSCSIESSGLVGMRIAHVSARCTSPWQQFKMYLYGSLSDCRHYYTYHFVHGGVTYLVLPPVAPDITSIDVTVGTGSAKRNLTFTRTAQ